MTRDTYRLPRWNMMDIYPGLQSPEFTHALQHAIESIANLTMLFDTYQIGDGTRAAINPPSVHLFETVIMQYNAVLAEVWTVSAYITTYLNTDAQHSLARALSGQLHQSAHLEFIPPRLGTLFPRLAAWIGSLDLAALCERSAAARAHVHALERAQQRARHSMTSPEEALAAELSRSGSSAWASLYTTLTARRTPSLAGTNQADRAVRQRSSERARRFHARNALPLAAALNGIKDSARTLASRRGWATPLDAALLDQGIDRETLDALLIATTAALPDFHRYLRLKAGALQVPMLAGYDLDAPLGRRTEAWAFPDAAAFILDQFAAYSPRMGAMVRQAFAESWVDAAPRAGKVAGGSCMLVRGGESRILLHYLPTFSHVCALAHELGHAYHHYVMADCTMLQRAIPLTLAETASTFAEMLVRQARLEQPGNRDELISMLDEWLQAACWYVFENMMFFRFEQQLLAERSRYELTAADLNTLFHEVQVAIYADSVDLSTLDPYAWMDNGTLFQPTAVFYNVPYMFGLLFALGLYARYRSDPDRFRAGYDDVLAHTGLKDVATLAWGFGINVRTPVFWQESLAVIRADIDRLEHLLHGG
jgi:pepF/M3 family oligoendopeptidase